MKRLISGLPLLFTAATALLAQDEPTATPIQLTDGQAAGLIAGCFGVMLIPLVIGLAIWLWIAIWIMKDSAAASHRIGHLS